MEMVDHQRQHQVFVEQQLYGLLLLIVFNNNLVGFLIFIYLFCTFLFRLIFCLFFALSLLLLYTNVRLVYHVKSSDI